MRAGAVARRTSPARGGGPGVRRPTPGLRGTGPPAPTGHHLGSPATRTGGTVSDDRAELLAAIRDKAVVHGDFVLSSGQRASWYVDLRRILLDGRVAPLAGRVMLD